MKELYKPIFEVSKKVPHLIEVIVRQQFAKARNEAVDVVNPYYEKWNEEWDSTGTKVADDSYYDHLFSRIEPALMKFNREHKYFVELHADRDEYCDIYGTFNWNGMTEIHLSFIPVNVEEKGT